MNTVQNQPLPVAEQSCCQLIKNCKIGEIAKRIGNFVVSFFVTIIVGIYEAINWTCEKIYMLICCKCYSLDEVPIEADRIDDTAQNTFPRRQPTLHPEPNSPDFTSTRRPEPESTGFPAYTPTRYFPPLNPTRIPGQQPIGTTEPVNVGPELPYAERVKNLVHGFLTEQLIEKRDNEAMDSDNWRLYQEAIDWQAALHATGTGSPAAPAPRPDYSRLDPLPMPTFPNPAPVLLPDNLEPRPAPGPADLEPTPAPALARRRLDFDPRPAPADSIARPVATHQRTPSPKVFPMPGAAATPEEAAQNRTNALKRIKELNDAVEVSLAELQAGDQNEALQKLAEIETGVTPGILKNAPVGVVARLKALPARIKDTNLRVIDNDRYSRNYGENIPNPNYNRYLPNPERTKVKWPIDWSYNTAKAAEKTAITRATDRLVELEKNPEAALLRLAQINTVSRLFSIRDGVFHFDLDAVLGKYFKINDTFTLKPWYDYACNDEDGDLIDDAPSKGSYDSALEKYRKGSYYNTSEQTNLVTDYISIIHDLLSRRKKSFDDRNATATDADKKALKREESAFKETVRTFIAQLCDADKNCVDQMMSQLESTLLDLVAEEMPSDNLEEKLKFKAGLALCQYRSKLVNAFTRELYPDESHMADLEREIKQTLAELLGLNGKVFQAGAKYKGYAGEAGKKAEKVGEAVFHSHNPLGFLQEETRAANNSVPATNSLRRDLVKWSLEHFGLQDLDDEDPFTLEISATKEVKDTADIRANYGGPLTFEATLYYLETARILTLNQL